MRWEGRHKEEEKRNKGEHGKGRKINRAEGTTPQMQTIQDKSSKSEERREKTTQVKLIRGEISSIEHKTRQRTMTKKNMLNTATIADMTLAKEAGSNLPFKIDVYSE